MSLATPNQRPYAQSARLKLLHVSSRCRPSVESIESAHESSPINNAVEAAMSLDVMLIVIEIVSLRCRNTCVASRIKFSIGQAVGHRLVSYPIAYPILEYGDMAQAAKSELFAPVKRRQRPSIPSIYAQRLLMGPK